MTVFVVYEYAYDDSRIHGVFSSEKKAEEYIKKPDPLKSYYYPNPHLVVTEWELQ